MRLFAIDANDFASWTNKIRSNKRHVATAGANVQYAHSYTDPGPSKQRLRCRRQHTSLPNQPLLLSVGAAKDVFILVHDNLRSR
jgi:hypothetical protein